MVDWINAFSTEYRARTGRYPIVYSTRDWWSTCTADSTSPGAHDPLWIANYGGSPTPLPDGWTTYTVWQHADSGTFPGDQDAFNGTAAGLAAFAHGPYTRRRPRPAPPGRSSPRAPTSPPSPPSSTCSPPTARPSPWTATSAPPPAPPSSPSRPRTA